MRGGLIVYFYFLMKRRPTRSRLTDPLFPYTTSCRSRLARTAGADERDELAAAHRDIDAVDHAFGRARAEQSRLAAIFDHRLLDRQQHLADAAARAAVAGPRQRAHELLRIGMPRPREHVARPPRLDQHEIGRANA